jgi:hypothetical protein
MTIAVGALNLVLGFVYIQYGSLTIIEMRRNWREMGFSHFGAAWIAMAFTCGPHHFIHGLHLLLSGHGAGTLDLVAVVVGFPAGVIWFLLRVEAFSGGRGDRFVSGSPVWVLALPTAFGMYLTAIVAAVIARGVATPAALALVAPNLLLVVIYSMIGYFLIRTQVANRRPLGGWSVGVRPRARADLPDVRDHARRLRLLRARRSLLDGPGRHRDRLAGGPGGHVLPLGRALSVHRPVPRLEPHQGDWRGGGGGVRRPSVSRSVSGGNSETSAALAAFLAWPAGARIEPDRSVSIRGCSVLAAVMALAVCVFITAASLALPLAGYGAHPWTLGGHLLLFCHLG